MDVVVDAPSAQVRRRRRTRWACGAAAAAVVVIAGGVAALTQGSDATDPLPQVTIDPSGGNEPAAPAPEDWRTEYWHGLAVEVPADWGYGGAPMSEDVACYPVAMLSAEGARLPGEADADRGWVGRPILMTDVCAGYPWLENSPLEEPSAPYAWLGAAVEPGIVEYENGYVQETVEVAGTTLTVGSDDARLRQRVLDSARTENDGPCAPDLPANEPVFRGVGSEEEPVAMNVCVYRHPDRRGEGPLTEQLAYATTVGSTAVDAYRAGLSGLPAAQCPDGDAGATEWVVLELLDEAGEVVRYDVVHLGHECAGIDVGPDGMIWQDPVRLVPDAVEPWGVRGVGATVLGAGAGEWQYRYFIGIQG